MLTPVSSPLKDLRKHPHADWYEDDLNLRFYLYYQNIKETNTSLPVVIFFPPSLNLPLI